MRTAIIPSSTGLLALALLSLACSSSDDDGGSPVQEFTPGAMPGAPAVPGVPGAAPDPSAPAAPAGVTPAGTEGQGTPPLAAPGAPAPAPGGDPAAPAAPVDGMMQPAPAPAAPAGAGSTFTSGAWTGSVVPEGVLAGTTLNPASYDARLDGAPFCLQGQVANDAPGSFTGVARIKFNLSQAPGAEPLAVTPEAQGLAFTFTRTTGSLIRVLLHAPEDVRATLPPDGASAPEGWCYAIPEVQGQVFVPYSAFNTRCFERTPTGVAYAGQPIEAVSFNSPGSDQQPIDYNFCVVGIADGNDVSAAPAAPEGFFDGDITGTLRASFERAVVLDPAGQKLVVQSNAWGDIVPNSQQLTYTNNSFTVAAAPQRSGGDPNVPLSFPSIYIGESGFIDGSQAISTRRFDNLPIAISQIGSIPTTFAHNATNQDANATYDVWFAAQPPTAEYGTATGAFLMVWTHKPGNRNAIGNPTRTATVGGQQWQVVVGLRSEGGAATGGDANAPVISYLANQTLPSYSFDLADFIRDAVQAQELNGSFFLTDVFAGFEIWSGGQGLSVTDFTVDVQPNQ